LANNRLTVLFPEPAGPSMVMTLFIRFKSLNCLK
jgi:hypothetical protein